MRFRTELVLLAGVAGVASAAFAQPAGQKVTGPVASYWMSASTQTGFGLPGMGGAGGKPSMGAMMGMMMRGGAGGAAKTLTLQLGSARRPPGAPEAAHLPPDGLDVGGSLPLLTPKAQPPAPREEGPYLPREYQKPRGRMLIFWGCGARARAGQPLVIDFAQIAQGKAPPALAAALTGLRLSPQSPPSPARNATYGEWPNERTRIQVPASGSLVGDHTVEANYAPQIQFALDATQDFLAPLKLTSNAKAADGSVSLGWNAVPNARAYLASAVGGGEDQVVLWTSSEIQASAFGLPDYISPADLGRLVASRGLMGPNQTSCQVPREVVEAAPAAMVQLAAYGDEANFVYPPRPKDPRVAWNKEWQAKVRYRSATGGILGMEMPGMDDGGDRGRGRRGERQPQGGDDPRRSIMRGLGIPGF